MHTKMQTMCIIFWIYWVLSQPVGYDITLSRRLLFAEPIPKLIHGTHIIVWSIRVGLGSSGTEGISTSFIWRLYNSRVPIQNVLVLLYELLMNFVLRNYDQHAAKDSSCPKRPGHHRIFLHPSVRVLQLVALYIWKIDRKVHHYSDVIWVWWLLKLPASRLFTQSFGQAQIKENIKAVRHWPLWGEFTGDRWIPRTKVQ